MKKIIYTFFCLCILFSCNDRRQSAFTGDVIKTAPPAGTIPDESIYNLTSDFITQDGRTVQLKDFAGKPAVVCMIFTHCTYACPRLTADVQHIEKELGISADKVNFLLVSFDAERDNPQQLRKFQSDMNLDKRFVLLHGDEDAVRTLSVLINVQYQKNSDGDFSHSNIITLLDKEGKLVFQKEGINASQDDTLKRLKALAG